MTWMPASTWTPPAATSSSPSSSSSRRSLAAWNGASPSWRTKPNRAAHRGCPASSPGPARNLRPPSSPGSPGPMAFPVDGWPPPTGWSRELPRLRDPVIRRLDPSHPVIDLPRVPAQVTEHVFIAGLSPCRRNCPPGGAGRGGLGEAALGGQPGQPDRHPAGGGEAAHPQHPMVSAQSTSCASAWAPSSPPSIAWRNRPGPRCRASWSASAAAPWSTPMRPAAQMDYEENGANGHVWIWGGIVHSRVRAAPTAPVWPPPPASRGEVRRGGPSPAESLSQASGGWCMLQRMPTPAPRRTTTLRSRAGRTEKG